MATVHFMLDPPVGLELPHMFQSRKRRSTTALAKVARNIWRQRKWKPRSRRWMPWDPPHTPIRVKQGHIWGTNIFSSLSQFKYGLPPFWLKVFTAIVLLVLWCFVLRDFRECFVLFASSAMILLNPSRPSQKKWLYTLFISGHVFWELRSSQNK